jgi:hypothetical protein
VFVVKIWTRGKRHGQGLGHCRRVLGVSVELGGDSLKSAEAVGNATLLVDRRQRDFQQLEPVDTKGAVSHGCAGRSLANEAHPGLAEENQRAQLVSIRSATGT